MRFFIVATSSGLLFAVLDGAINANPLAVRLLEFYKPLARTTINVPLGVAIDLAYGFLLAGLFLLLFRSLPGQSALIKGVSFALIVWLLRVVMSGASQYMIFRMPMAALAYILVTGLIEMLILGILYGLTLRPMAS